MQIFHLSIYTETETLVRPLGGRNEQIALKVILQSGLFVIQGSRSA